MGFRGENISRLIALGMSSSVTDGKDGQPTSEDPVPEDRPQTAHARCET